MLDIGSVGDDFHLTQEEWRPRIWLLIHDDMFISWSNVLVRRPPTYTDERNRPRKVALIDVQRKCATSTSRYSPNANTIKDQTSLMLFPYHPKSLI